MAWQVVNCVSISPFISMISNINVTTHTKMLHFLETNKAETTLSFHVVQIENKNVSIRPWTDLWKEKPQMGIYEKKLGCN